MMNSSRFKNISARTSKLLILLGISAVWALTANAQESSAPGPLAPVVSVTAPQAKDSGYKHVEVDLDRQVLLLTDDDGVVKRVLPVSTGSNKHYNEKGMSGIAYTPRGRFRIYAKMSGWRKSPLGMLYYPNYFSDGLAIHGNPSVPQSPESHGCIRIPMSSAVAMSKILQVGTIVLIYDKDSFVSAKDWATPNRAQ